MAFMTLALAALVILLPKSTIISHVVLCYTKIHLRMPSWKTHLFKCFVVGVAQEKD